MQSNNLADTGVPVILMAAILAVIPTVLLFLSLQRRFVEGINMTAGIR
jgi:multiple sugar transport system permease protein